ncbi:CRAL-TRIO domain-containing protein [Chytriomyces sp. MP71]|nr:CRAL-TRIO domain-containing protein [Chytriomyces sp. MP71]
MIATAFGTLTGVPLQGEREWATETDDTAVRYLKACKFDIEKAHSMLTKSLQWRREFRPTEIKPEDIESESETGKAFWSGHDRQGRAIWNVDASKAKTTAPEKYLKLMAYNLEKGALLNPEGVTQLSVVADVGSTSMWNQNPVSVTLQLVNMLQNHYPEKLGMALCVNPSSFMWILWTMLSGFVDPNTKAKIFFTSSSPDANTKKRGKNEEGTAGWVSNIDDLIELDQLCSKSGGTYPYEYNHAEYWAEIKKRLWE